MSLVNLEKNKKPLSPFLLHVLLKYYVEKNHGSCHFISLSPVTCREASCHMSILRKRNVAVSNSEVIGHNVERRKLTSE